MWNEKSELPDGSYAVSVFKIILSISLRNLKKVIALQ